VLALCVRPTFPQCFFVTTQACILQPHAHAFL